MMLIRIVHSKTDQLRQGHRVVVARIGTPTCPMAMLEQHFARTGMSVNDERFLFQPIQHTKNGEVLKGAGKISYGCLRELFNKKLKQLGFPAESFGLHSLRTGEQLQQPMQKYLIGCLRGMVDGILKMQRMIM